MAMPLRPVGVIPVLGTQNIDKLEDPMECLPGHITTSVWASLSDLYLDPVEHLRKEFQVRKGKD